MRIAAEIVLAEAEEAELKRVVQSQRTEVRMVRRAQIVLLAAVGKLNQEIAAELARVGEQGWSMAVTLREERHVWHRKGPTAGRPRLGRWPMVAHS